MAQHEVQAKRGLFSFLRKLVSTDDALIVDLLRYDNPPAVYGDNDLITKSYVDGFVSGVAPTRTDIPPASGIQTITPPPGYTGKKMIPYLRDGYAPGYHTPFPAWIQAVGEDGSEVIVDTQGSDAFAEWL